MKLSSYLPCVIIILFLQNGNILGMQENNCNKNNCTITVLNNGSLPFNIHIFEETYSLEEPCKLEKDHSLEKPCTKETFLEISAEGKDTSFHAIKALKLLGNGDLPPKNILKIALYQEPTDNALFALLNEDFAIKLE